MLFVPYVYEWQDIYDTEKYYTLFYKNILYIEAETGQVLRIF